MMQVQLVQVSDKPYKAGNKMVVSPNAGKLQLALTNGGSEWGALKMKVETFYLLMSNATKIMAMLEENADKEYACVGAVDASKVQLDPATTSKIQGIQTLINQEVLKDDPDMTLIAHLKTEIKGLKEVKVDNSFDLETLKERGMKQKCKVTGLVNDDEDMENVD